MFALKEAQELLRNGGWNTIHSGPTGPGVREIRIHVLGEWRVIYVAKFQDAVYVLHAFQKKTGKTSQKDIDLACRRYRQIGGEI